MKKVIQNLPALAMLAALNANAGIVSVFDSPEWTNITLNPNEDITDGSQFVNPGWGGQAFDAEFFFVKLVGNDLSIGLQTGFDILDTGSLDDGIYTHTDGRDYFAGEIALSFDGVTLGDSSTYEYAIDFGFETRDYDGDLVNQSVGMMGPQGLYDNVTWNDDVYFGQSQPFAMSSGTHVTDVSFLSNSESVDGQMSYYQIATFDITSLGFPITQLDAHWTMSCGNDTVDGHWDNPPTSVPEPSTIALLSTGLLGLMGGLALRGRKQS